jgi:hypothetical protein
MCCVCAGWAWCGQSSGQGLACGHSWAGASGEWRNVLLARTPFQTSQAAKSHHTSSPADYLQAHCPAMQQSGPSLCCVRYEQMMQPSSMPAVSHVDVCHQRVTNASTAVLHWMMLIFPQGLAGPGRGVGAPAPNMMAPRPQMQAPPMMRPPGPGPAGGPQPGMRPPMGGEHHN